MANQKMINIKEEIKLRLDNLKLCEGDSYGAVINRLIDEHDLMKEEIKLREQEEIKIKEREYALKEAKVEIDKLVQARDFTEDKEIPSLQQEPTGEEHHQEEEEYQPTEEETHYFTGN